MTLRHRLYLWLFTTDSNKWLPRPYFTVEIPSGVNSEMKQSMCWVWLAAATFPRPMRLSTCHEPPCWMDAQGNAHETTDTHWRVL